MGKQPWKPQPSSHDPQGARPGVRQILRVKGSFAEPRSHSVLQGVRPSLRLGDAPAAGALPEGRLVGLS